MSLEFRIEAREEQKTLSMRTRTTMADLPAFFDRAYSTLARRLGELAVEPSGPPFAYYHNMDFDDLDLEAGFPVDSDVEDSDEIKASTLPAGDYCIGTHVGSYDELPQAWGAASAFATEQGRPPDDFAIEQYLTNPVETAPDQNQTLIMLPVKGRG